MEPSLSTRRAPPRGPMRASSEARWRSAPCFARAAERQRDCSTPAARLVPAGGLLIYATCHWSRRRRSVVKHSCTLTNNPEDSARRHPSGRVAHPRGRFSVVTAASRDPRRVRVRGSSTGEGRPRCASAALRTVQGIQDRPAPLDMARNRRRRGPRRLSHGYLVSSRSDLPAITRAACPGPHGPEPGESRKRSSNHRPEALNRIPRAQASSLADPRPA